MNKDIVGIYWWDACSSHDRITEDDFKTYVGLAKMYNIGWVLDENDTRILLCNGSGSTGEFDIMAIPTNNIVERVVLCKLS